MNEKKYQQYIVQRMHRKKYQENRPTNKNIFKNCKKDFFSTLDIVNNDTSVNSLIGDRTTFNLKFSDEKYRVKRSVKKWINFTQKKRAERDNTLTTENDLQNQE